MDILNIDDTSLDNSIEIGFYSFLLQSQNKDAEIIDFDGGLMMLFNDPARNRFFTLEELRAMYP